MKRVRPVITCANCGQARQHSAHGLCGACRWYEARNGTPRPASLYNRPPAPLVCKVCKRAAQPGCMGHGRCDICRQYWRMNGRDRPAYLINRDAPCKHCAAPRTAYPGRAFPLGYCPSCAGYRYKHGKPRPAELIRRHAPLGWCECGALAVTTREIVVPLGRGHERRYNERLCARCERAEEAA